MPQRKEDHLALANLSPSPPVQKAAFLRTISEVLRDSPVWVSWLCVPALRAGGPPPSPRRASPTGFHPSTNPQYTKWRALEYGCVSLVIVFSIDSWDWERRKQIFIFLIINLLFLVLLHLYNYTLTGTCMKYSLQSEQEIGTKKWNASVVVGCCRGGWGGRGI